MVSWHLVRLDAELSVQLLARNAQGAALTVAGATFREYAAHVVAEIGLAKEAVLPTGELRGRLRVAAPVIGPTHFARILAEMAARHPELHIHSSYTDRFVDPIAEGYDCAIRVGMPPRSAPPDDLIREHLDSGAPVPVMPHSPIPEQFPFVRLCGGDPNTLGGWRP